jgi:hypothetical protein
MKNPTNTPILFDEHGDKPLMDSFSSLSPNEITMYMEIDTRVGKKTCRQTCEHCFYIREEEARKTFIDLLEARDIMNMLKSKGHPTYVMVADNFADNGEFMRVFGDKHNAPQCHSTREGIDSDLPEMMESGEAWTSGAPLLDDNYEDLLCTALENGFGSLAFTFHGIVNNDLTLKSHQFFPLRGVFSGADGERVIERVHTFNEGLTSGRISHPNGDGIGPQHMAVNMTVTVGRHNHGRKNLIRYVRYAEKMKVTILRMNRFKSHSGKGRLPDLDMSPDDITQYYKDIKWIHDNMSLNIQLGVSEDFGTNGIDVMEFPKHVGWCRAGHQFFGIIGDKEVVLSEDERYKRIRIGRVAGCVEIYKPYVGQVIRIVDKLTQKRSYDVEFYPSVIKHLQEMRHDGTLVDGCWAPEYNILHNEGTGIKSPYNFPELSV